MITSPQNICQDIEDGLAASGLFSAEKGALENNWRISPQPFYLSPDETRFFENLGGHLLKFYRAINRLYLDSAKGKQPAWIAEYLDAGKPSDLIDLGKMNRFKGKVPGIIRPDVIMQEDGYKVTELDSVPGGFGVTTRLMSLYSDNEGSLVGASGGGLPEKFAAMTDHVAGKENAVLAIVVSDEAKDYLNEMQYLGEVLREQGRPVYVVHPSEIKFKDNEGLFVQDGEGEVKIEVVYRFYELFDLQNIPQAELIAYAVKKGWVKVTAPYKAYLEEKLNFALFHHPVLRTWWENTLGDETFTLLSHLIPSTWILDDRPLPPHGVIPGLQVKGNNINDWKELYALTQKEREMVIKPSGFSPASWGSRGVTVGHDVSSEIWQQTVEEAVGAFADGPYILQPFHKGKRFQIPYWNRDAQAMETMESRARLTPYYFVVDEEARLGGILATLCPQDKKKIHGMTEAVMVPCATQK